MKSPVRRTFGLALAGITLAALAACGGCDDTYLTVKGVAAKGLAIAKEQVTITCAFGEATAVTSANGSYIYSITNGVGPCIVSVKVGTTTLRSITRERSDGVQVANVNPITEAIVAGLVEAKDASSAAELVKNAAKTPTATELTAAVAQTLILLNDNLKPADQIPSDTDLLAGNFDAATGATPSNDPVDKALDQLVSETAPVLKDNLSVEIAAKVTEVVEPSPTGGTGGTGSTGGTGGTGATGGVN